ELIMQDPAPFIRVISHNSSSIDIVVRVWAKSGDYWTVNFDLLEKVKEEFDANGIEIPFEQLDVHVKQD
ncbi:MAG: mechanosensitive ion channel, partial [Clostridia bacterium]|nr:mechanosensitive ion channel [Clostridia bacterium]